MPAIRLRISIPGPKSRALLKRKARACGQAVDTVLPIFADRAKGAVVTDVDGNRLLDFTSGVGALNAGHVNSVIAKQAKEQMGRLWHTAFHLVGYEPYVKLCEELNRFVPGATNQTLLFNSGSEAIENAVKIARRATGRSAVISFDYAFHGRTLLALSLTSKEEPYKHGFGPFAPECYKLPYPYLYRRAHSLNEQEYLQQQLAYVEDRFFTGVVDPHETACVVMELVAGEGGVLVAPKDYVRGLAKICKSHGIAFVVDEVQTGFGRTGKWFASQHYGIAPDITVTAKSIANGLPLAAVTARRALLEKVQPGGMGSTFGGNPVACAAALATLRYMKKARLDKRAEELGRIMAGRLEPLERQVQSVGNSRGLGAMRALEFVKNKREQSPNPVLAKRVIQRCAEQGLLTLGAGLANNVVRLLPALTMTNEHLHEGLDVMERVVRAEAGAKR